MSSARSKCKNGPFLYARAVAKIALNSTSEVADIPDGRCDLKREEPRSNHLYGTPEDAELIFLFEKAV
jgi:hypothetical protein